MRIAVLFLAIVASASASVISSGSFDFRNFGGPTTASLTTAGYTLSGLTESVGADSCSAVHTTTTCTLSLSNSFALSSIGVGSMTLGGSPVLNPDAHGFLSAQLSGTFTFTQAPTFDVNFTGAVNFDRAFQFIGTIVVRRTDGTIVLSDALTGSGTQHLTIAANVGAIGVVQTTNTFLTPEPSTAAAFAIGLAGFALAGRKRSSIRKAPSAE